MIEYKPAILISLCCLCAVAAGTLIYVTVFNSLRNMSILRNRTTITTVSLCVTLLCVAGMFDLLLCPLTRGEIGNDEPEQTPPKAGGQWLRILLVPYAVLGVCILLFTPAMIGRKCHNEIWGYQLSGILRSFLRGSVRQKPDEERRISRL